MPQDFKLAKGIVLSGAQAHRRLWIAKQNAWVEPADVVVTGPDRSELAALLVARWALDATRTEAEREAARSYLAQLPPGDFRRAAARIVGKQKKRVMDICPHCGEMADARHRVWRECQTGNRGGLKERHDPK